jgi:PAS domain-containing protein
MDLWVIILLVLAVPFLFIVVRTVYRLLHLQEDLEKTKHVVLSRELIDTMVKAASEEYSKELDLGEALGVLVQKLIDSVSVTSISFLVPVTENSTDYSFKTHLVYEVPESYVKDEQQALVEFAKEKFEIEIANISRNVDGGPINSKSKIKALSREVYPLEVGMLKGCICVSSRKSSHFSEVLKKDFKSLFKTTSSFLTILWEVARREHKKFKAMVDSMRDGVFMVDEEYRFLIANPALKEMMGLRSSAAVNIVRVSNFFSLHLSVEDVVSEVFVMGKVKKIEDIEIEDKIYGLTAIPVKVGNVVMGVVCLLEDQTHQK